MLLASIFTVLPVTAMAASEYESAVKVSMGRVDEEKNDQEALKEMVSSYLNNNYSTAAEMLADELASGTLDRVSAGGYNLYINRYSGFVFYENSRTGQILTSNPVDPFYTGLNLKNDILSQVEISYSNLSNPSVENSGTYDSMSQIEIGLPLKLSEISRADGARGISVRYALGVNTSDFRVPACLVAEDFVEHLAKPMFAELAKQMEKYCGASNGKVDYDLNNYEGICEGNKYIRRIVKNAVTELRDYALNILGRRSDEYKTLSKLMDNVRLIFDSYDYMDPDLLDRVDHASFFEDIPALDEGKEVYKISKETLVNYRLINSAITAVLNKIYSRSDSEEDLERTGYKPAEINSASFIVSINYYLNANGELSYEVPMSAPYFVNNNTNFTVQSITALKYFGAGDMNNDGYIFFPDGSGSIVEFETIKNIQPDYSVNVYGNDYGYATLTSSTAHLEPTTMPVFGLVGEVNANKITEERIGESTVTNGFFAIVEEGASLSNIGFSSGGSRHKYAMTYAIYKPHPSDVCDLSQTISVGDIGFYYIASESPYSGIYRTRVTMLADEKTQAPGKTYAPTYIGMAERYRDYLVDTGVITKLTEAETSKDIPLYIEVLGAMDVTKKILSFPVVVSTPLTTFENIETMYNELAGNGVKNINFRLTGFANGGMTPTYPVKVDWESSLGGDDGLADLINAADKASAGESSGFGIYPDFDFLYIHNEEMFDGISYYNTAAVMVDNRYASKQSFNAVLQLYESMFSLVISPDKYDGLYSEFNEEYSEYGLSGLSVATLGSELNSNFDDKNAIHREQSLKEVKSLFGRMASQYSVMTDVGNAYALKYVDHILNAPIDSSHYKYSTYTIPFYGMVLHSYVNYTGSPINYSGLPGYDILRSIENGASLQYILCYQNTNYLKDDEALSKYYGVDYKNWKEIIADQYNMLKDAIGDLQDDIISYHSTLIGERVIDRAEEIDNYRKLVSEYISYAETQFEDAIAEAAEALRVENQFDKYTGFYANIDEQSMINAIVVILGLDEEMTKAEKLSAGEAAVLGVKTEQEISLYDAICNIVSDLADDFTEDYPKAEKSYEVALSAENVNYRSRFNFITDSMATDNDYRNTEYTCDNKNIVMVTYLDVESGKETIFFINYNVYDVKIKIDASLHEGIDDKLDEFGYITLGASSFVKIQ